MSSRPITRSTAAKSKSKSQGRSATTKRPADEFVDPELPLKKRNRRVSAPTSRVDTLLTHPASATRKTSWTIQFLHLALPMVADRFPQSPPTSPMFPLVFISPPVPQSIHVRSNHSTLLYISVPQTVSAFRLRQPRSSLYSHLIISPRIFDPSLSIDLLIPLSPPSPAQSFNHRCTVRLLISSTPKRNVLLIYLFIPKAVSSHPVQVTARSTRPSTVSLSTTRITTASLLTTRISTIALMDLRRTPAGRPQIPTLFCLRILTPLTAIQHLHPLPLSRTRPPSPPKRLTTSSTLCLLPGTDTRIRATPWMTKYW